ncbi:DUF6541 family protein [Companilactobacillus sp.]|uniref:DUF6541 family protein n=1 Tax=Companilactobacillus sp. TaxID=2767905 RepID=UPI00263851C7|nr:DUF6541 family protein [Companilactobacillus sp.]
MKKRTLRTIILSIIFIILSILYTWLFAPHGYIRLMDSYDMLFHLNRVSSLGNIFVSPVNFDYWGHVGNMTSIFYPWLTMLPGFLIFQLSGNPVTGYLIFLTMITFLTFVSSYYFMKKFSDNTLQSFLFSVIYTLAFFRMASVFYRAGLAEYTCYIFIPMLFYELYQLLKGHFSSWPWFALSFALIVLTHPLTAFTTVIIMIPIVVLALFSKVSHHWKYWGFLILSGLAAIVSVVIVTAGFTIPMIQQQKYISVNRPALLDLASTAKVPAQLFTDAFGTDLRNYSFGSIMILGLVLLIIFVWKDHLKYRIIGFEMLFALALSTNLIPWNKLQDTFFNYLQFPWRFLNLFTFFAAIYISYGLTKLVDKHSSLLKLLMMIIVLAGCSAQTYVSGNKLNHQITLAKPLSKITTKDAQINVEAYQQNDYYPQRSIQYQKELHNFISVVNGKNKKLPFVYDSNTYSVNYYSQNPETIDLPVLVYKGLSLEINNESRNYQVSKRGTIQFKTKPGQNQIKLTYHYSTVAKAALSISFIGLILLLWLGINNGKFIYRLKSKQESSESSKSIEI